MFPADSHSMRQMHAADMHTAHQKRTTGTVVGADEPALVPVAGRQAVGSRSAAEAPGHDAGRPAPAAQRAAGRRIHLARRDEGPASRGMRRASRSGPGGSNRRAHLVLDSCSTRFVTSTDRSPSEQGSPGEQDPHGHVAENSAGASVGWLVVSSIITTLPLTEVPSRVKNSVGAPNGPARKSVHRERDRRVLEVLDVVEAQAVGGTRIVDRRIQLEPVVDRREVEHGARLTDLVLSERTQHARELPRLAVRRECRAAPTLRILGVLETVDDLVGRRLRILGVRLDHPGPRRPRRRRRPRVHRHRAP